MTAPLAPAPRGDMDVDCNCAPAMSRGPIWGEPDLFGKRKIVGFGDDSVQVMTSAKDRADEIIRAGHYSRSVAWASKFHFVVTSMGATIGALQYGPAMNPASGARIVAGAQPDQWVELNRMWLSEDKPSNCASRAVSFSLAILKMTQPRLMWVQSFADSRCGKLGAVYQACSFLYLGSHQTTFYLLDGEWFHQSMMGRAAVDRRGWGCGPKIERFLRHAGRAVPHRFTQYRYVKFLRGSPRRLLLTPLAYPKAVRDAIGERP